MIGGNTLNRFTFRPWHHRELLLALIEREVTGRYRGSIAGLLWSFLNPLLMLLVLTGMMIFNLFSECISRAPGLIPSNVNYVKEGPPGVCRCALTQ